MKYLKEYNSENKVVRITRDQYNDISTSSFIDFTDTEFHDIQKIYTDAKYEVRDQPNPKRNIIIGDSSNQIGYMYLCKDDDEYYYIRLVNFIKTAGISNFYIYRCDQFDSLIDLLGHNNWEIG